MWAPEAIRSVWQKGQIVAGYDATEYRKDDCGAWMRFSDYGNRDSWLGWEIDHIDPTGSDNLSNLRPLQWRNNLNKSDGHLKCTVTSAGNRNILR